MGNADLEVKAVRGEFLRVGGIQALAASLAFVQPSAWPRERPENCANRSSIVENPWPAFSSG
jgi:hypothetical protein